MTEREKRITIRVSEKLHRKVKTKAALTGQLISDVLREYLEEWTSDIDLRAQVEEKLKQGDDL